MLLAEISFSIFSRGCKQSNFSTQYGGKGIFFYNTFLKKAGFLINLLCFMNLNNLLITTE